MKTHTPGPWKITGHDGRNPMVQDANGGSICAVWDTGCAATQEANARLIAAAPDLLNMLQRVMDEYLMRDPTAGHVALLTLEHARAAIAKAKGAE